jgi:hypothetical protein
MAKQKQNGVGSDTMYGPSTWSRDQRGLSWLFPTSRSYNVPNPDNATPSGRDSLNGLISYLEKNNISPPVAVPPKWNGERMSRGATRIPYSYSPQDFGNEEWGVSEYGQEVTEGERKGAAPAIPHEIAHILQARIMGGQGFNTQSQIDKGQYGFLEQYKKPGTLENDATYGRGRAVSDDLRQRYMRTYLERIAREQMRSLVR